MRASCTRSYARRLATLLAIGVAGAVLVGVAACAEPNPGSARRVAADVERPALAADALVALAARADVAALDGDVALLCAPAAAATDAETPACDAAWVGAAGALTPWGRRDLLAAARLDGDRTVSLTRDRDLVLAVPGGEERVLARHVADPRVAPDRRAVVFTELRGDDISPATTGRLVVLDLDRGTRRVVTEHPMDSSPFLRPGTDDVLFVSARTGVASLWLARDGARPRQLTNVGLRTVDASFVPVPGRELAWLDGRTAVFTATYDGVSTLWALDVERGHAAPLGPGRWPQRHAGSIVAVSPTGSRALDAATIRAALAGDGASASVRGAP
ncbi:MAG TPA: hypothetical protein VM261_17595 [Kofleriaceae bacterium]|nr:hypothetical protein [Kofleriaceae bacterium]